MPKKTKKEKLKSLERRGNTLPSTTISETHVPTNPIEHAHHTFSFRSGANATASSQVRSISEGHTFTYLRNDLIKTVVLAALACGILVTLSFVWK